ncbi:MAG: zinc ribbon domain-containing protein [Lachnospiraceae bacterium]|nr:zinc ribbon domain-containing protein [Lachnospiraceae bacterium]
MRTCTKCGASLEDTAAFCNVCGQPTGAPAPAPGVAPAPAPAVPAFDPYNHTHEFDAKDISDNKVIAMLVYLMGIIGVVIALLASATSPYAAFHVRQGLKFTVVETLLGVVTVLLCWTIIVPIAAAVLMVVLFVCKIVCFFSICKGQAKEAPIICKLNFLR